MPNDQAQTILAPLQVGDSVKADAWEAYNSSANETELQTKLMAIKDLPDSAKADLWEAKHSTAPSQVQSIDALRGARQVTNISPTPQNKLDFSSPVALGQSLGKPIRNYIQQAESLTPQGAAEHPIQNIIGKAAGFFTGGNQGIGTSQQGILTNPVTGMILPTPSKGQPLPAEAASSAVSAIAERLPNAEKAGAALGELRASIGAHTVDVSDVGTTALRMRQLNQLTKATIPAPVRGFLARIADAEKGPLTFSEARDIYTSATKLSAQDYTRLSGPMKANMAEFTKKLGEALNETAGRAGKAEQLQEAMKGYSRAKNLESGVESAKEFIKNEMLKNILKGAIGGGAGYEAYRVLKGK